MKAYKHKSIGNWTFQYEIISELHFKIRKLGKNLIFSPLFLMEFQSPIENEFLNLMIELSGSFKLQAMENL